MRANNTVNLPASAVEPEKRQHGQGQGNQGRFRRLGCWVLRWLSFANNVALIPLFTIIVLEANQDDVADNVSFAIAHLIFCTGFLAEWTLGLAVSNKRRAYLLAPANLADLVSAIPLATVFQGARVVRILRVIRVARAAWRARRFSGKGARAQRQP